MTKDEIIAKLKTLKPKLEKENIILIGLFGSYARGDYNSNSDIDLLYKIKNPDEFVNKYGMFGSFEKINEIKKKLSDELGTKIDLVAKNSLNKVGEKYILRDLINV